MKLELDKLLRLLGILLLGKIGMRHTLKTNEQRKKQQNQVISFDASLYKQDQVVKFNPTWGGTLRYRPLKSKGLSYTTELRAPTGWGVG